MTNPHTAVAIAQLVFYVPILPTSLFVLNRNWQNRPRLAWYPLVSFTLFRLTGAILTIVLESNQTNVGVAIAATVLLNVGLVPLILSTVGIVRLLLKSSIDENKRARAFLSAIRIAFLAAIALLVASGGLSGSDKTAQTALDLAKAGYVVFAVVLVLIAVEMAHLFTQRHRLATGSFIYVQVTLAALPMLLLRAIYGLLYEFTMTQTYLTWNPLYGSAVAFALLCLLPEYVTVLMYIYLGFYRFRNPGESAREAKGIVELV